VPAGVCFGLFWFALEGSLGKAIFEAIFFALFFGGWSAIVIWRAWPGAKDIDPADRVAVARIVDRGDKVADRRLAAYVVDYATVVRRRQTRDKRFQWTMFAFPALTLILALTATSEGSTRHAVLWWVLLGVWGPLLIRIPRRRARTQGHAVSAEADARRLLDMPPGE
jgi:hypothetical protein